MNSSNTLKNARKKIIVPITQAIPRAGEGGSVILDDGNILFIYSRFHGGGADHDNADLFGGILDVDTGVFRDERVFLPNDEALNHMSVSLERLQSGGIGMVFIRKYTKHTDDVFYCHSSDGGKTWSEPVNVTEDCPEQYAVVNNDRLRQFSSGRLAIPVCLFAKEFPQMTAPPSIAVLYSDDQGASWQISERITIQEENIVLPHALEDAGKLNWENVIGSKFVVCRNLEPGVEQLSDGRILMYCRTNLGYMYQAYSSDDGSSWTPFQAAKDIVCYDSPQSIRRIPDSRRLVCVYNDRSSLSFGSRYWHWRTPLTLSVSDDDGATWRKIGNIEDDSHNYCYTSILFYQDSLLLTYYESENSVDDGEPKRRNLAFLKMQQISKDVFT